MDIQVATVEENFIFTSQYVAIVITEPSKVAIKGFIKFFIKLIRTPTYFIIK